ncbi:SRPBCC family protein [Cryobacterium arcticum]|uniref:SRPBCC family protein n=1 Tax=Cryobacterium arcticum TaxID=670052 RepID=UPI0015E84201|nr:SRPBCC domain-containing protein [Cryobacterium arcticum]
MSTVVVEIALPVSVIDTWALLTDDRGTWWPDLAFDTAVGAPLTEHWRDDAGNEGVASGWNVEVVPPRLLSFAWAAPGDAETHVHWEVRTANGGGSIVTVRESGLDKAATFEHRSGWTYHLNRLQVAATVSCT